MKSDRIKNWPKEERPRERLPADGAEKLTEEEWLAIILRVGQGLQGGYTGPERPGLLANKWGKSSI